MSGWMPRDCPKCGESAAFLLAKPKYVKGRQQDGEFVAEHLEWTCTQCGYVVSSKCADATDAPAAEGSGG